MVINIVLFGVMLWINWKLIVLSVIFFEVIIYFLFNLFICLLSVRGWILWGFLNVIIFWLIMVVIIVYVFWIFLCILVIILKIWEVDMFNFVICWSLWVRILSNNFEFDVVFMCLWVMWNIFFWRLCVLVRFLLCVKVILKGELI